MGNNKERALARKAETTGLTKAEVDKLTYKKIDENLAKVDEALKLINPRTGYPFTSLPDTVSS